MMEEDVTSRKRLKKKFLDRWENEGGRLCDDRKQVPAISASHKGESKVPQVSRGMSPRGNDNPPVGKSKRNKK
jgi:hypothetical protein